VELTEKQKGVVRGVVPAVVLSVVGLCGVSLLLPLNVLPVDEAGARLAWALQWVLLPVFTLMVSIARVGNYRFYSPEDIAGSGLTSGTAQVKVLRAVLQNTLEQTRGCGVHDMGRRDASLLAMVDSNCRSAFRRGKNTFHSWVHAGSSWARWDSA